MLEYAAIVTAGLLAIIIPLQFFLTKRVAALRRKFLTFTDERIKHMNEILQSFRILKFFAWEVCLISNFFRFFFEF